MSDTVLRRDAARNRQLLLDAAAEVFAKRGLSATLDDVAHHAGVGVATAYRRFANKQELIEALFDTRVEEIGGLVDRATSRPDAVAALHEVCTVIVEQMSRDRGLKDVLTSGTGDTGFRRARERTRAPLTRLLLRAQAEGGIRPDLEVGDFGALMWMLGAVASYCSEVDPDQWRRQLELLLDGWRATDRGALPGAALDDETFDRACGSAGPVARVRLPR